MPAHPRHYLSLNLDQRNMLVELGQIHMVLPIVALQMLPHDDPAFAGILNFHGRAVVVYHLSVLLDIPRIPYNLDSLLIISPLSQQMVGFLVAEEMEIFYLENAIQPIPSIKNKPYVCGVVEKELGTAWILDLEKLLSHHQSISVESHASVNRNN